MSSSCSFFCSSIGRKFIMAITGLGLLGFVVGHLSGNLQMFIGQDAINSYAEFLRSMPAVLWCARIGILAIFVLHIYTAFSLRKINTAARPNEYRNESTVQASAASLYMLHTGVIILIFVVIHLAHFTLGYLQPEYFTLHDAQGRHDVYSVVIHGFQNIGFSIVYLVAMCALGFHLCHAMASMAQTLGFNHPKHTPLIKKASCALAILIALGYSAIPVAVLVGILKLPGV